MPGLEMLMLSSWHFPYSGLVCRGHGLGYRPGDVEGVELQLDPADVFEGTDGVDTGGVAAAVGGEGGLLEVGVVLGALGAAGHGEGAADAEAGGTTA